MTKLMTEEEKIREAKNAYHREYRKKNRKRIRENQKKWREENSAKINEYNRNYWLKKAQGKEAK